jgi:hypothetical protein
MSLKFNNEVGLNCIICGKPPEEGDGGMLKEIDGKMYSVCFRCQDTIFDKSLDLILSFLKLREGNKN